MLKKMFAPLVATLIVPEPRIDEFVIVLTDAGSIDVAVRLGQQVISVIEQNGFTTYDDLVHGYGGGYFAPILGSNSRPAGHPATLTLRENMCLVVQPNVITRDEKAGVQIGELVRVTKTGCESLHRMPHGLFRAGEKI